MCSNKDGDTSTSYVTCEINSGGKMCEGWTRTEAPAINHFFIKGLKCMDILCTPDHLQITPENQLL